MVRIDSAHSSLEPELLRRALRGEARQLSASGALGLLGDPTLDIPQRSDVLAEAAMGDVPSGVAAMALRELALVDGQRALAAARAVELSEYQLEAAAALTIGLLGGEQDRVEVGRPDAPTAARVRLGAALLAHRFGRAEGAVDPSGINVVPASENAAEQFSGRQPGAIASARTMQAIQRRLPWLADPTIVDVSCGGRTLSIVTTSELNAPLARRRLTERPTVPGVIATESKVGHGVSIGLFILTRPLAERESAIVILRSDGRAAYSGTAYLDDRDDLSAELAAVSGPGVAGSSIRVLYTARGLEVFGSVDRRAVDAPLVPRRQPDADPPWTRRRPDERPPS